MEETIMIAILLALVLISSPNQVNAGEEFNASVIVENATDLAAFQIDITYENLELIKIEKGDKIKNWSIFDYNILTSNKVRVISAKFSEDSIESGNILNLKFKATKNNATISLSGILSDSNGNKINTEFRNKEVSILQSKIEKPQITTTTISIKSKISNFLHVVINYWYIGLIVVILMILLVIWKLR